MKNISLFVSFHEDFLTGEYFERATLRIGGRSVHTIDAPKIDMAHCVQLLRLGAGAHEIAEGRFDFTHIELNKMADEIINQ